MTFQLSIETEKFVNENESILSRKIGQFQNERQEIVGDRITVVRVTAEISNECRD